MAACVAAHTSQKYHARGLMVIKTNATRFIMRGCVGGSGVNGGNLTIGRGGGGWVWARCQHVLRGLVFMAEAILVTIAVMI
jgi:hypothetical protein